MPRGKKKGPGKKGRKTNITFYYADWCDGCRDVKPILEKVAKVKGWKLRQVNVEECHTKKCDEIDAVPTLEINGKPAEFEDLKKLL